MNLDFKSAWLSMCLHDNIFFIFFNLHSSNFCFTNFFCSTFMTLDYDFNPFIVIIIQLSYYYVLFYFYYFRIILFRFLFLHYLLLIFYPIFDWILISLYPSFYFDFYNYFYFYSHFYPHFFCISPLQSHSSLHVRSGDIMV